MRPSCWWRWIWGVRTWSGMAVGNGVVLAAEIPGATLLTLPGIGQGVPRVTCRAFACPWDEAHALASLGRCALATGHAIQAQALLRQVGKNPASIAVTPSTYPRRPKAINAATSTKSYSPAAPSAAVWAPRSRISEVLQSDFR